MDTTETITHIGLCAGYGGIELGLKRVLPALRTVALCEIEAFAIANLVAKMEAGLMDPAPIWTDLKTFPWAEFRDRVDILTGGYPCQPFSAAGLRKGADDPRHLWPFISSGIQILRPRLCFFENVEGHITLGLREVIADLEALGYQTAWGIFSAAECGAPHQRKRVFIMAHNKQQGLEGFREYCSSICGKDKGLLIGDGSCRKELAEPSCVRSEARLSGSLKGNEGITGVTHYCGAQDIWPSRPGQPQHAWEPPRVVGNAQGRARLGRASGDERHAAQPDEGLGDTSSEGLERRQQSSTAWTTADSASSTSRSWEIEQPLDRNTNGVAGGLDYAELSVSCDNRTDELRLLGNGVVPATAALAFRTLLKELTQ